jgi:hypothetical protein
MFGSRNGFGPAFSTGFRGWYMAQQNGFGPAFATGCRGWYMAQQSITPAADWLHSLIGPGGLLLVLSDQCAVPVLVLWVELEKK